MRYYPRSLFWQIVWAHLATVIIAALALPLLVSYLLQSTGTRYQKRVLSHQAQAVARGLVADPGHGWHVNLDPTLGALYAAGYDGRAYAVVDRAGRALAVSRDVVGAAASAAPHGGRATFFRAGNVEGLSVPVRRGRTDLWIVMTQDMDNPEVVADDIVEAFLFRFLLCLLPVLLLLPIINALLIWRSTQAVLRVSRRAAQVDPTHLDIRLSSAQLPVEIVPLVDATNQALDRLEAAFRTQSEFIANVAHELRTPLSLLRLQIDGLDDPARKASLSASIQRISHVVSQLLDLAALEQLMIGADEMFDLAVVARDVVAALAPMVFEGQRTIALSGSEGPIMVAGRDTLMSLALTNLIDNATRHTPKGTHIEVVLGADGSVAVEDDGPGIAAADIGMLQTRFWRADHARSDSAGIGLSIVERIVSAHEGRLSAENRSTGGAILTIGLNRITRFPSVRLA
jgi:signal transduction histidine kinase